MQDLVNVNGKISSLEDGKISVLDRGFLYGDSIYEVTYTRQQKFIFLQEHLDRLANSARLLEMPLNFSLYGLETEMRRTLEYAKLQRAYVRVVVTRGEGPIGLAAQEGLKNNVVIIVKSLPENPSWWYQQGMRLAVSQVLRNSPRSLDPNAKSGNYLNNVMAILEAQKRGFHDALMENKEGHITEGTTFNIWMVKGKNVFTPPHSVGILKGITREKILNHLDLSGITITERRFSANELRAADEAFLTSSTKEVVPVVQVDEATMAKGKPGKVTQKVIQAYQELVKQHLR